MSRYYEKEDISRRPIYDSGDDTFVRESMTLLPEPSSSSRPHSMAADASAVVRREHSISRSRSRSCSRSRSRSRSRGLRSSRSRSRSRSRARTRARDVVEDNFTSSTAGIGASILGAVVGGFVANRASEALQQQQQRRSGCHRCHRRYSDDSAANVPRIASTILGAVAGGLGANALTNHLEDSRDRDRDRQHAWERRYGREDRNGRGRSCERGDDEYDYVYEDDRQHERRRRSSDFRYRN